MVTIDGRHLSDLLRERFGDFDHDAAGIQDAPALRPMAARGSVRAFKPDRVPLDTIRMLCAVALSAPTKSDLQQRDIVIVQDQDLRARLNELVAGQAWVADAPELLIFCGNNRRQRVLHAVRGHPFANDHLDAFFNAVGDAAIALSAFVLAAEAIGLGTCPVSALRDQAESVSTLLALPDHVFPFAGLAVGWPSPSTTKISHRLPLSLTVHIDRYDETRSEGGTLESAIDAYDHRRRAAQPYTAQRRPDLFGTSALYGWSEDKARQYALPERTAFGAFVRSKGFRLD